MTPFQRKAYTNFLAQEDIQVWLFAITLVLHRVG